MSFTNALNLEIEEEKITSETEKLLQENCSIGYFDLERAVAFGMEFGLNSSAIYDIITERANETLSDISEVDVTHAVCEHVLQEQRRKILDATGYDIITDSPYPIISDEKCFYLCTFSSRNRLIEEIAMLGEKDRENLLDRYTVQFLQYLDITVERIERMDRIIHN